MSLQGGWELFILKLMSSAQKAHVFQLASTLLQFVLQELWPLYLRQHKCCGPRRTVEVALEHSESSRLASLLLDPGGKAEKLSEDLPQTRQILKLFLQEGSPQHDQGEEVGQLQQDYKLLASHCQLCTAMMGWHHLYLE
jgi:hypothetical protein